MHPLTVDKGVYQEYSGSVFLVGAFFIFCKGGRQMLREGQTRIPSGCAISGIFSKQGKAMNGADM